MKHIYFGINKIDTEGFELSLNKIVDNTYNIFCKLLETIHELPSNRDYDIYFLDNKGDIIFKFPILRSENKELCFILPGLDRKNFEDRLFPDCCKGKSYKEILKSVELSYLIKFSLIKKIEIYSTVLTVYESPVEYIPEKEDLEIIIK